MRHMQHLPFSLQMHQPTKSRTSRQRLVNNNPVVLTNTDYSRWSGYKACQALFAPGTRQLRHIVTSHYAYYIRKDASHLNSWAIVLTQKREEK